MLQTIGVKVRFLKSEWSGRRLAGQLISVMDSKRIIQLLPQNVCKLCPEPVYFIDLVAPVTESVTGRMYRHRVSQCIGTIGIPWMLEDIHVEKITKQDEVIHHRFHIHMDIAHVSVRPDTV